MMNLNEAFKVISDKVEEALAPQGFQKVKAESADRDELVALFVSDNLAYSVVYYKSKLHVILRECPMTDDGPDNDWKTLSTWMFDPDQDTMKEAASIGNDFAEALSTSKSVKHMKQTKKSKGKKDEEGNADPVFLAKRFVALFPELKEEIIKEEDSYDPFRGVTFTKTSIVPRINELLKKGNAADIKKLGAILSAQYGNGDLDTRSIITAVILMSVPAEYDSVINENLTEDLQKIFAQTKKLRGKTIKPEKEKKQKQTIAQRLEAYNK